jgi:GNAT superfamily N-acetyltransferase
MRVIDHTEQAGRTASIADLALVRRVGIDDYSDVRYVHLAAFKAQTAGLLSDAEAKGFVDHVSSPDYADVLQRIEMLAAIVNGQLVGTAAWSAGDDTGSSARISSVFVDPMFGGCGIGRRLVREIEKRAADAGYARFTIRATANAVPFFQGLGYEVASHGVGSISAADGTMPVTFLRKVVQATVEAA